LLRRLGALLRKVHATPIPASLRLESSWIDRMLEEVGENLGWPDGTPELLADLFRRRPAPVPEVLIHGDLALDNVLINGDARPFSRATAEPLWTPQPGSGS
jgi:aminoglycoside phosphotransferase (APT) family kinase protein